MTETIVGLFGTCGNTTFRKDMFIPKFEESGIAYYNPQLGPGEWSPSCAEVEAEHLASDDIILFPITEDTYGLGSLSEVGFSFLQAVKLNTDRDFIVLIQQNLVESLMVDNKEDSKNITSLELAKESLKMRALVKQHIKKMSMNNVYIVDTLEEMLDLSVELHKIKSLLKPLREKYSIKTK
jgi:hypothetical protein